MISGADTPLGVYKIWTNPWIPSSESNRASYGPNPRLGLEPVSGEIVESGRSLIRMHGGRQEIKTENGEWIPIEEAVLKKQKVV